MTASKVFAITGGVSGIGAASAHLLAERGAAAICIGDVAADNFTKTQTLIGKINPSAKVWCKLVGVTSSKPIDRWFTGVITTFGDLHGVANVAGIPQFIGQDPHSNLNNVFYSTRVALRAMKEFSSGSDRAIVSVASMTSIHHNPDAYAYWISIAGFAHFTQSMAKDTRTLGIRVNWVSPAGRD
ncbi:hypothetical protein BDV12DRAFT_199076 [Aspergillus spectabilis]